MGCVASKPDINDRHANIFQVVNVDEVGHRFSPAKLEVTEADLVLHQRGKAAIRWPLRCLRRYGFDAELFSFESGRRCPTGPGIYAFRCRRAEALFNMLQLQIQNITEDAASRDLGTALPILPAMPSLPTQGVLLPHEDSGAPDLEGYLEPLQQRPAHPRIPNNVGPLGGNSIVTGGSGNMDAVGGAGYGASMYRSVGAMHSPVSPTTPLGHPPTQLYDTSYDTLVGAEEPPPTPGHDARDPLSTSCMNHVDKACPSWPLTQLNPVRRPRAHPPPPYPSNQVYVNVMPDNRHVYVNMLQKEVPVVPVVPPRQPTAPGSGSSHSGTTTTTTDTDHHAQINYIVLEMDPGSDSSAVPPTSPSGSGSPQGMCKGYAQIDFDKTRALNAAKQAAGREDGLRKTRHNSTFSSATPTNLAHHNSSFSD